MTNIKIKTLCTKNTRPIFDLIKTSWLISISNWRWLSNVVPAVLKACDSYRYYRRQPRYWFCEYWQCSMHTRCIKSVSQAVHQATAWFGGGCDMTSGNGYERLLRKYAVATDTAAIVRMAPIVLHPTVSGMYRRAARYHTATKQCRTMWTPDKDLLQQWYIH